MRRQHWPEIEDQAWFPSLLRDGMTGFLQLGHRFLKLHHWVQIQVEEILQRQQHTQIVDLASGAGGMIPYLAEAMKTSHPKLKFVMTDYYPNHLFAMRWNSQSELNLEYREDPINATSVPSDLKGIRTCVGSFHHFRPPLAKAILADAMNKRQPIIIAEGLYRGPVGILSVINAFFATFVLMPFVKPFRLNHLIFTYFIPLYPFLISWDGLASMMRMYSKEDFSDLVNDLQQDGWQWEIGTIGIPVPNSPMQAPYLIGRPSGDA